MYRACFVLLLTLACSCYSQEITYHGPDDGGYCWVSSRDSLGPDFLWEDISNTGTPIGSTGYSFHGPYAIPFSFPWYGVVHNSVWINPNGLLSLNPESTNWPFPDCPVPFLEDDIIGAFLGESNSGEIRYQAFENRWIVQFTDMDYDRGGESSWQAVLHSDGSFHISHLYARGDEVCSGWEEDVLNGGFLFPRDTTDIAFPDSTTYLVGPDIGDFESPVVIHEEHPDVETCDTDDYIIHAEITDRSGIASVWLIWEDHLGAGDSLAMGAEGNNQYYASIPYHAEPGWIRYRIRAYDASEHANYCLTAWIGFLVHDGQAAVELQACTELNSRLPLSWRQSDAPDWTGPLYVDFETGIPEGWTQLPDSTDDPCWQIGPAYHISDEDGNRSSLALRSTPRLADEHHWFVSPSFRIWHNSRIEFDFLAERNSNNMDSYLVVSLFSSGEQPEAQFYYTSYPTNENSFRHIVLDEDLQEWLGQEIRIGFAQVLPYFGTPGNPVYVDNILISPGVSPDDTSRELQFYEVLRNGVCLDTCYAESWTDLQPDLLTPASYQIRTHYENVEGVLSEPLDASPAPRPTRGGPDSHGYQWIHSDDPEGPTWSWWNGLWTEVPFSNSFSDYIPCDIDFMYYGLPVDSFTVTRAGGVHFLAESRNPALIELPCIVAPNGYIAALVNQQRNIQAYYAQEGAQLRLEFRDIGGFALCQLQLSEDGSITWFFRAEATTTYAVIGQENEWGTDGLQIAFCDEGARIGEGVAIRSAPDPSVDVDPPAIFADPIPDQCFQDELMYATAQITDSGSGVREAWYHYRDYYSSASDSIEMYPMGEGIWAVEAPLPMTTQTMCYTFSAFDNAASANYRITEEACFNLISASNYSALEATLYKHDQVELEWTLPYYEGTRDLLGYRVFRDGQVLCDLTPVQSYIDSLLLPYQLHNYAVSPVFSSGATTLSPIASGQATRAFGPDAYGYTCVTSDQPDGPEYNWIEIADLGTVCTMSENSYRGPYHLGFEFPYYGESYSQLYIFASGILRFDSSTSGAYTCYSRHGLPDGESPHGMLALCWEDFAPTYDGAVYFYQDLPNERFIVEYVDVRHRIGVTWTSTFEAILYPDGRILMQYADVAFSDSPAGIESPDGLQGLYHGSEYGSLRNEYAVLYSPPEPIEEQECEGQQESEPNQGWSSDPPTATVWNGDSTLCGNLLDDNCDCFLFDASSSLYLQASLVSPELDCRLLARSFEPGLWEFSADSFGMAGYEALELDGVPTPFYLCVEAEHVEASFAQYQIQLHWQECATPCNTAEELGILSTELTFGREAPANNHFDLLFADTQLNEGAHRTAGHDDWYHFEAGFDGNLRISMQADGLGDEVLALFSGCSDPGAQLIASVDEQQYGWEEELLLYPIIAGEEYWLQAGFREMCHSQNYSLSFELENSLEETPLPDSFALLGAFPNPFNPVTHIRWQQPQAGEAVLQIYNLRGQLVELIQPGMLPAGEHALRWDAAALSSGMYFFRLQAPDGIATGRLLLIK